MSDNGRAMVFGLIAVLLWSTVATVFKLSLRHINPTELLLLSTLFSILTLGTLLLIQGKIRLVFQCSRKEYQLSLILGFLNPLLYYLILFKAYDLLPAQQAQPINYTWAITLSLLSVPLLKQKIYWQQFLALFVSYAGVVIISTEGDVFGLQFTNPVGVLLALGSTVIWALYWIVNTRENRDPVVGLFVNFTFSFPLIVLYYLFTGDIRIPPVQGILGGFYVGLFEMGICFVVWLSAMKLTDNTARISNLIFLAPFFSLVFIHFFLGEKILPATYIGLVFIIAGLMCQRLGKS